MLKRVFPRTTHFFAACVCFKKVCFEKTVLAAVLNSVSFSLFVSRDSDKPDKMNHDLFFTVRSKYLAPLWLLLMSIA